jgi:hypothetical protein
LAVKNLSPLREPTGTKKRGMMRDSNSLKIAGDVTFLED